MDGAKHSLLITRVFMPDKDEDILTWEVEKALYLSIETHEPDQSTSLSTEIFKSDSNPCLLTISTQ